MILVDSSVWVDHFRNPNPRLVQFLSATEVLSHAFIVGELAVGSLRPQHPVIRAMQKMPQAIVASDVEFLTFLAHHQLAGHGLSFVDVHLLIATQLTPDAKLWTRDNKLQDWAKKLALAA